MTEMAASVAGKNFTVLSIVPEGVSPHTYEPSPADITAFSSAEVWFSLGRGFLLLEDQIADALPDISAVATGLEIRAIAETDEEIDPHIWLSAQNGICMTDTICQGLSKLYPDQEEVFSKNAKTYIARLQDIDRLLSAAAESMQPKIFLTTHGSFGYLAADYNISQLVIAGEGREPAAQKLAEITDAAKAAGVHLIITEPLSGEQIAVVLAEELGVSPVKVNPLSPNYTETLHRIAEVLKQ
jgi:zinc transport system substrate-binding protein